VTFVTENERIPSDICGMIDRKSHWEQVYGTKQPHEVSWTQDTPHTSLEFIHGFNLPKDAAIIDIGGGDSKLVDYLLREGFTDLTVLDISETAIERAKARLGIDASKVHWIVSDILTFQPQRHYDLWHDRATFHFLTTRAEIDTYLDIARRAAKRHMVIGTFSETGPLKCSMLEVHRYSKAELALTLERDFKKIKCINTDHATPFHNMQNFTFCSFSRRA
jgi:ubiquinone/menaquinone biosynthesis C-methylase UbiE